MGSNLKLEKNFSTQVLTGPYYDDDNARAYMIRYIQTSNPIMLTAIKLRFSMEIIIIVN